ncbi:MAG: CARDB domain-containing protein [Candidatus Contendobacter sp.]|nr:CARDB domain-containing protein [Candidatus Contendobacter sp.]
MKFIKLAFGTVIVSLLFPVFTPATAEEISNTASSDAHPVSLLQAGESMAPARRVILRHDPSYISTLRVPPPPELALQQQGLMAVQATITINFLPAGVVDGDNCLTWPDQPKAAFSYAANLWASQLQSPVPITIDACWASNLPAGVLGHGGPNSVFRNFSGAPVTNTWYSVPAANALHGSDLDPAQSDIYSAYSSTFSWYFGTDGNTPPGQVDFASVVLHEIAHGLGFLGSMQVSGGQGSWGLGTGFPIIYDRFTENGSGQKLIDTTLFPNPSAVLTTQLTSNDIYFNGTNANAGNGGARVPLYAPFIWSPGSSYAHLAESYNNTPNALMTYSLPNGESIHSPGPVTLGLLKDVGWTLQQVSNNYTLTLAKAGTGNGTVSGGGSYPAGATVTLTATPDAGSTFTGWSPSPCAPSFTMPANNLACTATFNLSQAALPDLVVTSVTGPSSAVIGSDIVVTVTIKNQGTGTANTGLTFQASVWIGPNSALVCDTTLNLPPGASTTCSGTAHLGGGSPPLTPGTYNFAGYADPLDKTIESNETNNAFTSPNMITITGGGGSTYTLTLTKTGSGSGTVSGGGTFAAGTPVTLTATPNPGSTFAGWSPSPCASSFTMPASNLTCTATFNATGAPTATETIGLYNPTTSVFYLRNSNTPGIADNFFSYGPPGAGWIPIAGDWNGNGVTTIGLYNPTTSVFYLRNSNTPGIADNFFSYGPPGAGWIPIVGDWNGDGVATIGLYNPATSVFYLRNSNTPGIADNFFNYGPPGAGWIPIVGDWNGDGTDTIGLYNPATSVFYLRNSNTQGIADNFFSYGPPGAGWIPVVGDWNGDGTDTIGLYNPATSVFYPRNSNTQGIADLIISYGPPGAGWKPLAGDWNGPGS